MVVADIGAVCFGLVVGWITYRTLRRGPDQTALSDIATIVAAVGGGAVTALFNAASLFGYYAIGLAVGFFGYFGASLRIGGSQEVSKWMGD